MKTSTLFAIASACSVLLRGTAYAVDAQSSSDAEPAVVHQKETAPAADKGLAPRAPVEDYSAEERLVHGKAHGVYSMGKIERPGLGHITTAANKGLLGAQHSLTFPKIPLPSSSGKLAGGSHVKSTTTVDVLHHQPALVNLGGAAKGTAGAARQPITSHTWHTVGLSPSTVAPVHGRIPGMASLGGPARPRNLFIKTDVESKSKF